MLSVDDFSYLGRMASNWLIFCGWVMTSYNHSSGRIGGLQPTISYFMGWEPGSCPAIVGDIAKLIWGFANTKDDGLSANFETWLCRAQQPRRFAHMESEVGASFMRQWVFRDSTCRCHRYCWKARHPGHCEMMQFELSSSHQRVILGTQCSAHRPVAF